MSSNKLQPARANASGALRGNVGVAGDKSISHRVLLLGAQALGNTVVRGLLRSADVLNTMAAVRAMGIAVSDDTATDTITIHGQGTYALQEPANVLDFGNAGTGARLTMGVVAGHAMTAFFTGDESLRRRPMERVLTPLKLCGAHAHTRTGGLLPLMLRGTATPLPIEYTTPVPSAQIKSAVLLAGLNARGDTRVIEREATRDHTERLLQAFGAQVHSEQHTDGLHITVQGGARLQGINIDVPADPSSAAFLLVAALLVPNSEVTVRNVCLNPLRTGLFTTLQEMGADLTIHNQRQSGGEDVGDITARHSALRGVVVPAERAPSMIDEYPILAIAAACAQGTTHMQGLSELRVKESDRLSAVHTALTQCGVRARIDGDDLWVDGGTIAGTAADDCIKTHHDHRLAMSFLCAGLVSTRGVAVDDVTMIDTSFPQFMALMRGLGASIAPFNGD